MSEDNQRGWFSGVFNKIFSSGENQRKRPRRSLEVEDEPSKTSITVNEPKRMRSEYSVEEPLSTLYPSSANRSIDVRSKILQPPTRTQQILNELEKLSSPKPNTSKMPSLKRWEEIEEWSFDTSKYKSPFPPKKSLFTPTRLHEITARYARGTPKNYWRRPFFNNSWAAKQDDLSPVVSKGKPTADDDVQIIGPSTSRTSTEGTEFSMNARSEEKRLTSLLDERRPHIPVVKSPTGRNIASNLKPSINTFKITDEELVVDREEINENDLSKVKPLPFKPSIPAGFLTSQNQNAQDQQPFAFSFSQPVERGPKAIVDQETFVEKQSSPKQENGKQLKFDSGSESKSPSYESDDSDSIIISSSDESEKESVKKSKLEEKKSPVQIFQESPKITEKKHVEDLTDKELQIELKGYGFEPGPITDTTRIVYVKKLNSFRTKEKLLVATRKSPLEKKSKETIPTITPTVAVSTPPVAAAEEKKWMCMECWVHNEPKATICICCGAASPNSSSAPASTSSSAPKAFTNNLFQPQPAVTSAFSFGIISDPKKDETTSNGMNLSTVVTPAPVFSFGNTAPTNSAPKTFAANLFQPQPPVTSAFPIGIISEPKKDEITSNGMNLSTVVTTSSTFSFRNAAPTTSEPKAFTANLFQPQPPVTSAFSTGISSETKKDETTSKEMNFSALVTSTGPSFSFRNTPPTTSSLSSSGPTKLFGNSLAPASTTQPVNINTTEAAPTGFNFASAAVQPAQIGNREQISTQPSAFNFGPAPTGTNPFQIFGANSTQPSFNFGSTTTQSATQSFQFVNREPISNQPPAFNFAPAMTGTTPFQFSGASSTQSTFNASSSAPNLQALASGFNPQPAVNGNSAAFLFAPEPAAGGRKIRHAVRKYRNK